MKSIKTILSIFAICGVFVLNAQNKNERSTLILGTTAHIGNGDVIKNSAIGIKGTTINLVMSAQDYRLDTNAYDKIGRAVV